MIQLRVGSRNLRVASESTMLSIVFLCVSACSTCWVRSIWGVAMHSVLAGISLRHRKALDVFTKFFFKPSLSHESINLEKKDDRAWISLVQYFMLRAFTLPNFQVEILSNVVHAHACCFRRTPLQLPSTHLLRQPAGSRPTAHLHTATQSRFRPNGCRHQMRINALSS